MRKTLLSLCAVVAMSAGLLAGPMQPARQMKAERAQKVEAVQLQPKALQAEQTATLQATELQAQHPNLNEAATLKPVQTGQMLRASKPQTKAAQRAGEAEEGGTVLTYVADSAMVNTVFKENADYTVKTTIKNDSTAAYTGKVCVQFYADIYGIGYYFPYLASDSVEITVPASGEQTVSIPGHIDPEVMPAGQYAIGISNEAGALDIDGQDPGVNIFGIIVQPDPSIHFMLSLDSPTMPDTIAQYADNTLALTLKNTGGVAFEGQIAIALLDTTTGSLAWNSTTVPASVAANDGTAEVTVSYNVANLAAGAYRLAVGYVEGSSIYFIADGNGVTRWNVIVKEADGPALATVAEQTEMPTEISLNTDFTVKTAITNTGADFTGDVMVILVNAEGYIVYETASQQVTVAKDATTGQLTFTGNVSSDDVTTGEYTLAVAYLMGGRYFPITLNTVTVLPDPTAPVVSMVAAPEYPDTITRGVEFTFTVQLQNTGGGEFKDTLTLRLMQQTMFGWLPMWEDADGQEVVIAANDEATYTYTGTIAEDELTSGNYYFALASSTEYIALADGRNIFPVSVTSATDPIMSLVEMPTYPMTIALGSEFTYTAQLQNTGGGDFDEDLTLALLQSTSTGYATVWEATPQQVTVAANGTGTYTYTGTITEDDLQPGTYYFGLATSTEYIALADGSGNIFRVEFVAATEPIMSLAADPTFASPIKEGEDLTVSVQLKNAGGGDYTGEVMAVIMDAENYPQAQSEPQAVTVPANGTYNFTATISTADLAPGNYLVGIVYEERYLLGSDASGEGTFALEIQESTALQAVDGVAVVIYPNPATDFVMVNNGTGIDQVRLYSLTGALVLDEAVNGTASHRLDLDRLPAGAYLLSVDTPEGIITERIMKE